MRQGRISRLERHTKKAVNPRVVVCKCSLEDERWHLEGCPVLDVPAGEDVYIFRIIHVDGDTWRNLSPG